MLHARKLKGANLMSGNLVLISRDAGISDRLTIHESVSGVRNNPRLTPKCLNVSSCAMTFGELDAGVKV